MIGTWRRGETRNGSGVAAFDPSVTRPEPLPTDFFGLSVTNVTPVPGADVRPVTYVNLRATHN